MNRLLTFPQRAFRRGSLVLALLLCASLALASGCSHDYPLCPDCPDTAALAAGTFDLVSVDGKTLPYTPPNQSITILAGTCVTTTAQQFTLTVTTTNGKDTTTATSQGSVLAFNKGQVTFHFSPSDVQAQAVLNGNGFVLGYSALNLGFERRP